MDEREFYNQLCSLATSISAVLNMKDDFLNVVLSDGNTSERVNFMLCTCFDEVIQAKKRKVNELLKQIS